VNVSFRVLLLSSQTLVEVAVTVIFDVLQTVFLTILIHMNTCGAAMLLSVTVSSSCVIGQVTCVVMRR